VHLQLIVSYQDTQQRNHFIVSDHYCLQYVQDQRRTFFRSKRLSDAETTVGPSECLISHEIDGKVSWRKLGRCRVGIETFLQIKWLL